jgi:hypothetical protein
MASVTRIGLKCAQQSVAAPPVHFLPRTKTAALSRLSEPHAFSKAFTPPDDVLGRRLQATDR